MKNSIRFFLGFSLFISIGFYGCRENPQPEIKAAQRELDKARGFHSEALAATEWKEAMQAWEEAQAAYKKGDDPVPYFKKARALFEKTTLAAQAKGLEIEKEIDKVQKTINESYLKIKADLAKSRIKPKIKKEVESLLMEVANGSSSVGYLTMHGDYPQAQAKILDTKKKMLDAEMLMAGKKPSP
jgi:hypothetical protein